MTGPVFGSDVSLDVPLPQRYRHVPLLVHVHRLVNLTTQPFYTLLDTLCLYLSCMFSLPADLHGRPFVFFTIIQKF